MAPPFSTPHIESSPKRVRVLFGGQWIVDTTKSKLVWEKPYYPNYFFVNDDVNQNCLRPSKDAATEGKEITYDVVVGERVAKAAVVRYASGDGDFTGLTKITFGAMDAWFEEEEQIFVHPKDPYKRVDVLQSSKHIRVEVDGVEIANSTKPRLLFETSLRVRTYIPKTDCRLDLFERSELTTACPYKGVASYYSVRLPESKGSKLVEDIVWWYRTPQAECIEIKGYVAFYDEKVDVWVDGVKQPR